MYQLSQAVFYLAKMIDMDGKLRLEYVKEEFFNVLKLKIPSPDTFPEHHIDVSLDTSLTA